MAARSFKFREMCTFYANKHVRITRLNICFVSRAIFFLLEQSFMTNALLFISFDDVDDSYRNSIQISRIIKFKIVVIIHLHDISIYFLSCFI